MTREEISAVLEAQRKYYRSGRTLPVSFRKEMLRRLYDCISKREGEILSALHADLGKSSTESFMCEVGLSLSEISFMLTRIKKFNKAKRVKTPLSQFVSSCYKVPVPYGNVLIMSPWNYPFLLTVEPLVDAIAAGNTAIVKPSAYSPNTSLVVEKIIAECFPPEYVTTVTGGRQENSALLDEKFDLIFFTGSQAVGKEVLRRAAEHLTPSVLELGGKSPCIVDKTANIKLSAKRIVFGKYLNCGQTCVAPDYILCDETVKEELIAEMKGQIISQFGTEPLKNENYGKIINEKHFNRLLSLIDRDKVVIGGESDSDSLKIEPTVMDNVLYSDAVMGEEIFGPLLPVITYSDFDEVIDGLKEKEKPLALYLFTRDKRHIKRVTRELSYGGGCINDVIVHLATSNMGFGGVGESGMGTYHGKAGFDTFTHYKSVMDKKTFIDLPMRYQPYSEKAEKMIGRFLK